MTWNGSVLNIFSVAFNPTAASVPGPGPRRGLLVAVLAEKSRGESEDERGDSGDASQPADLEWTIFMVVWAFLLLNVGVYLGRSQK